MEERENERGRMNEGQGRREQGDGRRDKGGERTGKRTGEKKDGRREITYKQRKRQKEGNSNGGYEVRQV